MLEDSLIFYDRNDLFRSFLDQFARRLPHLGTRRIKRGKAWYWVPKDRYQKNEVFEL